MDWDEFAKWGARLADWSTSYHKTLADRPVLAQTQPGAIAAQLPATPPDIGTGIDTIFDDFQRIALPGMTHWQPPRFFA